MLARRTFCALAAGAFAAPRIAWGQEKNKTMTHQAFFYVSLGPALTLYRIDVDAATLTQGSA